jgi:hypothetical protein
MGNKLSVWIISDDMALPNLQRAIAISSSDPKVSTHVFAHLEVRLVGSSLRNSMGLVGTPDIIILDMSCVTLQNMHDTNWTLLKQFARKHTSSIICLVSAVMVNAEEAFKELQQVLDEEVVVEKCTNNLREIASYLVTKTCMYYPAEK